MLVSFDIMFLKVWHSHMTPLPCFLENETVDANVNSVVVL
jgi:hypothetical protein